MKGVLRQRTSPWPFMQWRRGAYIFSALTILVTLISLALFGLNQGIDFTGGASWTLRFDEPVSEASVREVFAQQGFPEAVVQVTLGTDGGQEIVVRTRSAGEDLRNAVSESLRENLGAFTLLQFDDVSPIIGIEIRRNALIAMAFAMAGMILYITIRFEFRFAVTAVIALLHDLLIMLAVFVLFRFEVNATFIAALLTIFGYSVNDTIVVYDRVRENLPHYRRGRWIDLMNDSLNQTLPRSIYTSLTTALAILPIIFFGGETIREFAIALLVGIVAGTYSSMFIAGPLWVDWNLLLERRRTAES